MIIGWDKNWVIIEPTPRGGLQFEMLKSDRELGCLHNTNTQTQITEGNGSYFRSKASQVFFGIGICVIIYPEISLK